MRPNSPSRSKKEYVRDLGSRQRVYLEGAIKDAGRSLGTISAIHPAISELPVDPQRMPE